VDEKIRARLHMRVTETAGGYQRWAELHAMGIAAAAPRTAQRRAERALAGDQLRDVRRRTRELHPCGIKGCDLTSYKGQLCRKHWALVPYEEKVRLQVEAIQASRKVAEKHHRRFLRIVRDMVETVER